MEEDIIQYLREKHNPAAIILHGSRAIGRERISSDWDIILLVNEGGEYDGWRELYKGENVEVWQEPLPIKKDLIIDIFGLKLQNARLLYEKDNEGSKLLSDARSIFEKGFVWPKTWPEGPDLWMKGRIDGMEDNVDQPGIFYKYFSDFYPRALQDWYRVLHKRYSQPVYLALPEIKEKDPTYYSHLRALTDEKVSLKEKTEHAKAIRQILFGEK